MFHLTKIKPRASTVPSGGIFCCLEYIYVVISFPSSKEIKAVKWMLMFSPLPLPAPPVYTQQLLRAVRKVNGDQSMHKGRAEICIPHV